MLEQDETTTKETTTAADSQDRSSRAMRAAMAISVLLMIGAAAAVVWIGLGQAASTPTPTATAVATRPAPTATAVSALVATPAPTAPAGLATVTTAPATATSAPVTATAAPASPTAGAIAPTPTESPVFGKGRQPLPPNADLTDGPFLRERAAQGRPHVTVDDGQLGSLLAKRFAEAMEVEEFDVFLNSDDSRVREYFTGEALERQLRRIKNGREGSQIRRSRILVEHRIMRTILGGQGEDGKAYLIADAAIERPQIIKPYQRGSHQQVEVISEEEPTRVCNDWLVINVGGSWKFTKMGSSLNSGYCPDGWN